MSIVFLSLYVGSSQIKLQLLKTIIIINDSFRIHLHAQFYIQVYFKNLDNQIFRFFLDL